MLRLISSLFAVLISLTIALAPPASAQAQDEIVWVQVEAQPNLTRATERAQAYASVLENISGFAIGGGWYGIVLGPYTRADAEQVLRSYRATGVIPRDSFVQLPSRLRQQFWPAGVTTGDAVTIAPSATAPAATPEPAAEPEVAVVPEPQPEPADETPAEARRSERDLTRDERKDLQIALQWAGFYNSAIDGAFGRGTRRSMSAWQEANNFEVTGILTTLQRAELFRQYNAVLDGLGLAMVRDEKAGIELLMPTAEVGFAKYEPPFAHYDATGDIGARVLLISQAGDQNTLFGLYEIMQTLEIVPLNGERARKRDGFTLKGENARIVSETQVTLRNGQIKGFTLVWPAGDEERRTRVLDEMRKNLVLIPNVTLDPAEGGAEQSIDLVAGLQIRKPIVSRSGFFVDRAGTVATTTEVLGSCGRLTLDGDIEAEVLAQDDAAGVALLKPSKPLSPVAVADFETGAARLQSEVSVAGFSYEGVLSAATLTFGTVADLKGLTGEPDVNRLTLRAQKGDAGGPVFDTRGSVIGMLLPKSADGPQLPDDTSFALQSAALAELATNAGLSLLPSDRVGTMPPRDLTQRAQGMTVLVSCWE